jgi:hypothetical protein
MLVLERIGSPLLPPSGGAERKGGSSLEFRI